MSTEREKNVADSEEGFLEFSEEDDQPSDVETEETWKILIVDDDVEVHNVTKLALGDFKFDQRSLEFLSVYSGKEAREFIQKHPDTAVVLLDVVMEEEDSGLKLVEYIRDELKNKFLRIVLRTGQPGQAPEEQVIADYDINDYKTKTELTSQKLFTTMIVALRSYQDLIIIEAHKQELSNLLEAIERFVPKEFLSHLQKESILDVQLGDQVEREMSVLFSDIRDFTMLSEKLTPAENFRFTNSYLSRMEPCIRENGGFIDKFIGDAIMALFPTDADAAVRAAVSMLKALVTYNQDRAKVGYQPIRVGIGLNTGALMLGTVGGESRMDSTVISDAVNLASRLESLTKLYGANLLIGQNTYDRLTDISEFSIRMIGLVQVKGKSEPVRVYEVTDGDDSDVTERKGASLEAFGAAYDQYLNRDFEASVSGFQAVVDANPEDRVSQMYLKRSIEFAESGVAPGWTGVEVVDFKP